MRQRRLWTLLSVTLAACGPATVVTQAGPPGDVYAPALPHTSSDVPPPAPPPPRALVSASASVSSPSPAASSAPAARPAASAPRAESRTRIEVVPGAAMGSLTRQEIAQAFETLGPAIVACVDTHRDHRITTLGLAFTVQPSGKVSHASFPGYAGITSEGLGCVRSTLLAHTFPEAPSLGSGNVAVKLVQGGR